MFQFSSLIYFVQLRHIVRYTIFLNIHILYILMLDINSLQNFNGSVKVLWKSDLIKKNVIQCMEPYNIVISYSDLIIRYLFNWLLPRWCQANPPQHNPLFWSLSLSSLLIFVIVLDRRHHYWSPLSCHLLSSSSSSFIVVIVIIVIDRWHHHHWLSLSSSFPIVIIVVFNVIIVDVITSIIFWLLFYHHHVTTAVAALSPGFPPFAVWMGAHSLLSLTK